MLLVRLTKISFVLCYIGLVSCRDNTDLDNQIPGINENEKLPDTIAEVDIEEDIQLITQLKQSKPNIIDTSKRKISVNEPGFHKMTPGKDVMILASRHSKLEVFCYDGGNKTLASMLKTVEIILGMSSNNFRYYEGINSSAVHDSYNQASWFTYTPWQPRTFRLDIYNSSCLGIETSDGYSVSIRIRWFDLWRVLWLVMGVMVFCMAPLLAHNVVFHYTTGILVGICGSVIFILYMFSRMIPKKSGAFLVLAGGSGMAIFAVQYLYQHSIYLLKEYQTVAVGYVVVSGLVSFGLVYRWGPITDERSLYLVQWVLQLTSVIIIFFSSQYREATLGLVLILLLHYNIPISWRTKAITIWRRQFPPKVRLLSEEEYLEQSRLETRAALQDLRKHCQSPECNAWKTVSSLTTPQRYAEFVARQKPTFKKKVLSQKSPRFAEFIEGGSHLTDHEIMSYEVSHYSPSSSYNDDDDEDDDDLLFTDDEEIS